MGMVALTSSDHLGSRSFQTVGKSSRAGFASSWLTVRDNRYFIIGHGPLQGRSCIRRRTQPGVAFF
jgi:hypothetical protein